MRKKYDNQNDARINDYFLHYMMKKYIVPSLVLLVIVFACIMFGVRMLSHFFVEYSTVGFVVLICINVLVSIATISVVHTINTFICGFKQLNERRYTVIQLKCLEIKKRFCNYKCLLSDNREYSLYDKKQYVEIQPGVSCDLIIITNEYGAKLWEIVLVSQNRK